jgi:hypothetical protein
MVSHPAALRTCQRAMLLVGMLTAVLVVIGLTGTDAARAACLYYRGQYVGNTQGSDDAFFRVSALHLRLTLTGHWQAGTARADATETDTTTKPPREALHPPAVSPPFSYTWPDCNRFHGVNVYGPDRVDSLPASSAFVGTWSDSAADDAGDPNSGTCSSSAQFGPASSGDDLLGNLVTHGQRVRALLVLAIRNFQGCDFDDRLEYADFSDVFAGDPGQLRYRLTSNPVWVSADSLRHHRAVTLHLAGHQTYDGRWKTGSIYPGGTEHLDVSWTGSLTLSVYAHCVSTPWHSLSHPGELHCHLG